METKSLNESMRHYDRTDRCKRMEYSKDKQILQSIAEEERESYDNMPESLQEGERGNTISENADDLENANDDFESMLDVLREIVER